MNGLWGLWKERDRASGEWWYYINDWNFREAQEAECVRSPDERGPSVYQR